MVDRAGPSALEILSDEVATCRACPRLVAWREQVAVERRASFRHEAYWGQGVPGFGDPDATVLLVGLAPAAHGANRTGRMFTGDRSGEFLYASLHRCGYANQPRSDANGDGLALRGAYVTAAVRCAPPANKPMPAERDRCLPYLVRELAILASVRVVVPLGNFGYEAFWRGWIATGRAVPVRRPRFGHGVEVVLPGGPTIVCSFHPSQQNTFTGRLTPEMLDAVFVRARTIADGSV
jgi:uracil-DNA glycosylase family 4